MAIIIEAYHTNRAGESANLVDANTEDVIFPYGNGSNSFIVLNTDEVTSDRNTITDENNTDGIKLITFYKYEDWYVIGAVVPNHILEFLYDLKVIRNKYVIINNERIPFYDIIVEEGEKEKEVVSVTLTLLIKEKSITGNY